MSNQKLDCIYRADRLLAMDGTLSIQQDAAVGVRDGLIEYVGPLAAAPVAREQVDFGDCLLTPALVDCHTHLVYAGDRSKEFERRLNGETYADISRSGGGIRATVAATRAASEDELYEQSLPRIQRLLADGVGTVEIKSGYGLDVETEMRMLRVARRLGESLPVTVRTSFLGAHALPSEFDEADDYIDFICSQSLPAAANAGLVDAVDGFCENIAFSPEQMARVFTAGKALGLPVKLHSGQLSDNGGTALAASMNALSADHLEYLSSRDIKAMAASGTVAVLLPGAFYFLGETQLPPVQQLIKAGVPIAIATDCNPGSSPISSLLTVANMACVLFGLTPSQVFAGCTRHAAAALGMSESIGSLEVGKRADLAAWRVSSPATLITQLGQMPLHARVHGGEQC